MRNLREYTYAMQERRNSYISKKSIYLWNTSNILRLLFAVWFVVGNVWIFGGRSSAAVAPNLYRYTLSYTFNM
ncbi:transmembrane protein, putative [Medicago truncatula]|uniref:Transmembrane protein, putative n=1 Tax=Medicago truncatula TaxID=3880 RepID=G7I5T4_MEDTR|nr:transmembrane protein, putative [Medicago truncatula]